jgi:3'-phosphoadenosine 5'-phosphosulfate (PAPS) 3'-phosphatase
VDRAAVPRARHPGRGVRDRAPDATRRWIVDPIDGTKSFVRGVPLWGTLVAVTEGETVLAGAAYFPATAELVAARPAAARGGTAAAAACRHRRARRGDGAHHRREVQRAPGPARRVAAAGGRGGHRADVGRLLRLPAGGDRARGGDGRRHRGRLGHGAFLPIIEEAGGAFTSWEGARTAFGRSAIATNGALAAEVRRVLADPDGARQP